MRAMREVCALGQTYTASALGGFGHLPRR